MARCSEIEIAASGHRETESKCRPLVVLLSGALHFFSISFQDCPQRVWIGCLPAGGVGSSLSCCKLFHQMIDGRKKHQPCPLPKMIDASPNAQTSILPSYARKNCSVLS